MHYSDKGAGVLKLDYIESAWNLLTTEERVNFLNSLSALANESPDAFDVVHLAKLVIEEKKTSPGLPGCMVSMMALYPAEFWASLTEEEQEVLASEIDQTLAHMSL